MVDTAWEVARLVAELDPSVPRRLQQLHPAAGRCRACGATAPCSSRRLADVTARVIEARERAAARTD